MGAQDAYQPKTSVSGPGRDLARDLVSDVVVKLGSASPYIRKRGVLLLYKCILKYPEALRPAFPKLKDRLTDRYLWHGAAHLL